MSRNLVALQLIGDRQLKKAFKQVGGKNTNQIAKKALRKPAEWLTQQVRNETPIQTDEYGIQDGVLRLSIEHKIGTRRGTPFVVIGPSNNPAWTNMNLGQKLTQVAHRVEFGTPKYRVVRWTGGYWNRRPVLELESNLPARSFVRKAFDLHGDTAMVFAMKEMKRLVIRKMFQIQMGKAKFR